MDKHRWINVLFRVANFNSTVAQKVVNSSIIISDLCHGGSENTEDAKLLGAISSITGINHRCTRINTDNEALFLFSSYFAI
ncbi:hypothetical protein IM793_11460 [Pedobacter sp. MR2016-19]|uniref:hypothetical protein n=1 Tax=Pedobacter sp. MR2016-19 TaxID=2780089 RepID=UPI001874CDF7|nr:hypothetical protein [Pedobacter sp. MR2016-19]MBE5319779.1 hypothetical protein [Pedobacter sp. MR2016-19]